MVCEKGSVLLEAPTRTATNSSEDCLRDIQFSEARHRSPPASGYLDSPEYKKAWQIAILATCQAIWSLNNGAVALYEGYADSVLRARCRGVSLTSPCLAYRDTFLHRGHLYSIHPCMPSTISNTRWLHTGHFTG